MLDGGLAYFRDEFVAASLKLRQFADLALAMGYFRDEFVAASLKQVAAVRAGAAGPISATNSSRPH